MDSILVTKKDAARMLGISLRTIDNLLAGRELPSRRIGRRVLIPRRALEQFARGDHRTLERKDVLVGASVVSASACEGEER